MAHFAPTRRAALQRATFVLGAALCFGAVAQTKEVVIGYQDMVVPWRYAQETQEVEKRTGYKVTYRKLGSGAEVARALASGAIHIGEAGSAPFASGDGTCPEISSRTSSRVSGPIPISRGSQGGQSRPDSSLATGRTDSGGRAFKRDANRSALASLLSSLEASSRALAISR